MLPTSEQSISLFVFFLGTIAVSTRAQCITGNDVIVNKTSIDIAVRRLIDSHLQFSLDMLSVLHQELDRARGDMERVLREGDAAGIFRALAPGSWLTLLDGLDYAQRLEAGSGNLFFSPYGVWSSLMVLYMGARGTTEDEMGKVLRMDIDKMTAWEAFKSIRSWNPYHQFQTEHSGYDVANRIFFQNGTTFKDCMKEILGNEIAFLEFEKKPVLSRDEINAWAQKQTRQMIKDLIPADGFNTHSRMIIASAVYFKKNWLHQFDPKLTRRRRFTISSQKEIFVTMMKTRGRFLYGKSEELQLYAVELPYSGYSLSIVILLPNNRFNGVSNLANRLTPHRLQNVLEDLYPREVNVSIPKFKLEDSFEMVSVLKKMGLMTAFDAKHADLSGFTGQREFNVDAIYHKASIVVNEEGTEGVASASAITSSARTAMLIADYPFVFLIRNPISQLILFLGTVLKPPEYRPD